MVDKKKNEESKEILKAIEQLKLYFFLKKK